MSIRGVLEGVKKARGVIVAPPHQIHTKKIVVPLTIVSGWVLVSRREEGKGGVGSFKLKCWSVLQNLVPYMWHLLLAQASVQRRVIGPDKYGFCDVSCALCLPMDYAETVCADWVSCGACMLMDRGWGPEMFFEPIPKCSASLSNVLLRAVDMWVLIFGYDPTFL